MQQPQQQRRINNVETIPHTPVSMVELENCVKANVEATNNELRTKAETFLSQLRSNQPIEYISGLGELLGQSKNNQVRSFSAVLLRQSMGILDCTFDKVPNNIQNNLKKLLLNLTQTETDRNVLLQVTQLLGALACKILHADGWPELIPYLMQLSKSNVARHKEAFLIVLENLCEFAFDIIRPDIKNIKIMLIESMQDKNDHVRIAAIKSTTKLLLSLEETKELPQFKDIVPLLFKNIEMANKQIITNSNNNNNNNNNNNETLNAVICDACSQLHGLTQNRAEFFADTMKPIVQCLSEVVNSSQLEWETRRMAMDLLVTLVSYNIDVFEENDSDLLNLSNKVIPLCFLFLHNFDETLLETDWEKPSDISEQINFLFGCEMLTRISQLVDIQLFWDLCYQNVLVKGFQPNSQWRDRLTALATIDRCIESCQELFITDMNPQMGDKLGSNNNNNNNNNETDDKSEELGDDMIDREKLGPIVRATGQSLTHPNVFIRYEALIVIKQLSIVFGNYGFQDEYHSSAMNALNQMIAGNSSEKEHRCVKIQVCDTLAHFCYEFEPQLMQKYADTTLNGLYKLLQTNDSLIQSDAFKAVSVLTQSIADVEESRFGKYYDSFMKLCKDILTRTMSNELFNNTDAALLRGRAMECIGNILVSMCCPADDNWIKNDKCIRDSHDIMKVMLPYLEKERQTGLESYSYMNNLFASIAIAIRSEFKPYLKTAISPLIEACKLEPVRIEDVASNGVNMDSNNNNENINNINSGTAINAGDIIAQTFHVHGQMTDKRVELHTTEAMEQTSAVKQLHRYAEHMGIDLFEFVEPICTGLLPIMTRKGNSEMRRTAVNTMPYLVEIYVNGLKSINKPLSPNVGNMLNAIIKNVINSMVIEEDVIGLTDITEDLIDLLGFVNINNNNNNNNNVSLSEEIVNEIVEQIGNAIQERILRRSSLDDSESPIQTPVGSTAGSTETNSSSEVNDKGVEQAEADLGNKLCDLVSKMTQLFGNGFVQLFHDVSYKPSLELFQKKATNEADWIFGLSIFGEIIQHGGESGARYIPEILNKCSEFLNSKKAMNSLPDSAGLKQSIAFTVGIIAQKRQFHKNLNPKWWSNAIKTVIIDNANPLNSNDYSHDNGVSAIGKIMDQYWNELVVDNNNNNNSGNGLNIDMIGAWIDMLPIRVDMEERVFCNQFLLKMLQLKQNDNNNGMLLNVLLQRFGNKMVGKLVEIISVAVLNEDQESDQFKAMFLHMKKNCNEQAIKQSIAQLEPEFRSAFA